MDAEIVAIGSELLTPFRSDTNSLYLTARLNEIGIELVRKTIVGDARIQLTDAIASSWSRADIVITMGGLGPTADDLTRECVAEVLGRTMFTDESIAKQLAARFQARGMTMPQVNLRQAMVITGATVLPNSRGTAPGQWIEHNRKHIILLPGPPRELEQMFVDAVLPTLRQRVPRTFLRRRQLRMTGLTESAAEEIAAPIYTQYTNPVTTILASLGEIQLHLTSSADNEAEAEARVDSLAAQLEAALGSVVFSNDGRALEEVVGGALKKSGASLAVAESCTGGLLGERITCVAGSSAYFVGGVISYADAAKRELLQVPDAVLDQHGAVSEPTARLMAEGVRSQMGATYSLAITGIAGPGGASADKPVGLVYIALAGPQTTVSERKKFSGERQPIRWQASQAALDLLRRHLAGLI
jgi:nicotinamide-nucleotide amidase